MSVFFPPDRVPCFDVLLLGLGPDGHTCSLFPDHKVLNETSLWVCPVNDSPKPPPCRITLTLPVINNANKCIFVALGSNKAEVIKVIILLKPRKLVFKCILLYKLYFHSHCLISHREYYKIEKVCLLLVYNHRMENCTGF